MALSQQRIINEAKELRIRSAALMAVDLTESNGNGFLYDKKTPKILFEPHIFWKQLRERGIDPERVLKDNVVREPGGKIISSKYADILYPIWGTKKYGDVNVQHARLQRAAEINRDAALCSASWGRYQIMGYNWKLAGCLSLQEFINKMYRSEDEHLDCFSAYIKNTYLDDELRALDWAAFARGYNGKYYWKNEYDKKLARNFRVALTLGYT